MEKILVYGTGNFTKRCFHVLSRMADVVGFIDSDQNKRQQHLYGLPIFHYTDLPRITYDRIVICSIFLDDISKILLEQRIAADLFCDYDTYYGLCKQRGMDIRVDPSPKNYFLGEQYICQTQCITENFWTENRVIHELDNGSRPVFEWIIANHLPTEGKIRLLDIGCGPSQKVATYFGKDPRFEITGLDSLEAVTLARKNNPQGTYLECDLDSDSSIASVSAQLGIFDIIVCLDVIEHTLRPEKILHLIKNHANHSTKIFITTLERDLSSNSGKWEGSRKAEHVREWNEEEFTSFIRSNNFIISETILTKMVGDQMCQTVFCFAPTP